MAVRKIDFTIPDSRKSITMRNHPTRIEPMKLKLGKLVARHDPRTLLASYSAGLPTPPASVDLSGKVKAWGMMDNDQIGDCTCAAAGHLIMEWTANAAKNMFTPSDQQIVSAYSAITGYNPGTGANDNGAVEIDVLNYWRQTGIAAHKIGAYVALEPANHTHIMDSVYIFEGCYIGMQLPTSATGEGKPGSWGGHAVPVIAYDIRGITCVTWGALQQMTWSFWEAYCEEAYAVVSADYLTRKKTTPQGFNLQQLQADLQDLK